MIVYAKNVTERSATIFGEGEPINVSSSHKNYDEIVEKLISKDYEGLEELIYPEQQELKRSTYEGLEIKDGFAYINGRILPEGLSQKLIQEVRLGRPVENLAKFAEKLLQNPSRTAVSELYLFIESGNMGICEDGDFLAYKKIRDNYKDCHTGTFDNSPGQILEMPRNEVDDVRDNLCSYGFHFCSFDYLHGGPIGGSRVVLVKINPKDVVAIPADYDNTKGRTCRYEVLTEVKDWKVDVLEDYSFEEDRPLKDVGYDVEELDDYEDDDDWFDDDDDEDEDDDWWW